MTMQVIVDRPRGTIQYSEGHGRSEGSSQRTCVVSPPKQRQKSGISRYQMSTHHGVWGDTKESAALRCCWPKGNRSVAHAVTPFSPMGGVNYCADLCTICGGHRHMQVMQPRVSKSLPTDPLHRLLTTHKATSKSIPPVCHQIQYRGLPKSQRKIAS